MPSKAKSISPPTGRRVSPPAEEPSTPTRSQTPPVEFGAKRTPQKHAKPVQRKSTDVDRQYVTRIHNKWYDLREFKHPGGPVARSLADGRDGTALFVAHHPFSSPAKLDAVLAKYEVPEEDVNKRRLEETILKENDLGDDYQWSWSDPFELELKKEVKQYFEGEAKRRGVSFFTATKATPRRWLEILVLTCIFVATVPAFVRGENWTLLATPLSCWVWMVNYWHDACHFALCRTWWINASLPYLGIWFSSPTTWYHQHVIGHHAYPNIEHKDPDLAHAPQLLREHRSVRWRPSHVTQHRWYRFTAVWAIAVGIGLHLAADFKLLCQQEYNRAVTANPRLYLTSNIAAHLFGRAIYLLTTVVWPWFVFETWQKSLVFSLVPMIVFSLTFMINSQINHLTPDTAHAHESNYYRHQIVTAQDFGEGSAFWKGFCFFMSGGLNFQIEHHLFPTVCHCHLAALKPIVRRLCAKHGVQYNQRAGYRDALEEHFVHSRLMGEGKFGCDAEQKKAC